MERVGGKKRREEEEEGWLRQREGKRKVDKRMGTRKGHAGIFRMQREGKKRGGVWYFVWDGGLCKVVHGTWYMCR
jgi:hypothetical protein